MTAFVGTPRKRCISIPTQRKTWQEDRRSERGLTDVSLCYVCYFHYSDIIIPVALYLTAPSLFRSGGHPAPLGGCISYDAGVLLYQSFFVPMIIRFAYRTYVTYVRVRANFTMSDANCVYIKDQP